VGFFGVFLGLDKRLGNVPLATRLSVPMVSLNSLSATVVAQVIEMSAERAAVAVNVFIQPPRV
jgi:hypothetical protein